MATLRLADEADIPAIRALMTRSIGELQRAFLSPAEIEASRAVMGLDTTLIADGTYWLADIGDALAGCGGWSRRATLYGGDHSTALRDARLLDPTREPARIRAMFTDPDFRSPIPIFPAAASAARSSTAARRKRAPPASPAPR